MRLCMIAVLTLASYPTFDPNRFSRYAPGVWKNHAISDVFEPGSTFKMVTAAAAFESLKVSPDDPFFCENGRWNVARRTINDTHPYATLDVARILHVSSNICTAKK